MAELLIPVCQEYFVNLCLPVSLFPSLFFCLSLSPIKCFRSDGNVRQSSLFWEN
uniref:Uncharacterized protein n=1 Tax=Anguilla anguilla TaxID=7936 RepID=A0A0E9WB26_ANGAN